MARPKKENADYFSHDNNMRNDPKIKALRRKYGITGYAVYNMLLEVLTESEQFNLKIGRVQTELLAGDFDCEPDLLSDLIEYAVAIELLERSGELIFSSGLKKRLQPVIEKREAAREREMERQKFLLQKRQEDIISVTETTHKPEISAVKTIQSKVNESKVNNDNNDVYGTYRTDLMFEREILKYFGFNENVNSDKLRTITSFIGFLKNCGRIDYFKLQYEAYKTYKEKSGEKKHNFLSFFGHYERGFSDGRWDDANWHDKLASLINKKPVNKPAAPGPYHSKTEQIISGHSRRQQLREQENYRAL